MAKLRRVFGKIMMDTEKAYFEFCPSLKDKHIVGFLYPLFAQVTLSLDSGRTIVLRQLKGGDNNLLAPNDRIIKWDSEIFGKAIKGAVTNVSPVTQQVSIYILVK